MNSNVRLTCIFVPLTTKVTYSIQLRFTNYDAVNTPIINITRVGLIPKHEQGKQQHMSP